MSKNNKKNHNDNIMSATVDILSKNQYHPDQAQNSSKQINQYSNLSNTNQYSNSKSCENCHSKHSHNSSKHKKQSNNYNG